MACLVEHYAGAFPLWLSPVQVVVIPIADRHLDYAYQVMNELRNSHLRVQVDERSERMNLKIREAELNRVPYMLVVGDKEKDSSKISLRLRSGDDLGTMLVKDFIYRTRSIIEKKSNTEL